METINPRSLNEISLEWLNAQAGLKISTHSESGARSGAETLASISAFKVETVGETAGFLGDICRVFLTWSVEGAGPSSIIAKFPTLRASNLETGQGLLAYEREMKFYQHFSAECSLNPPKFYGGADVSGEGDYLLLMEDLAGARFVSQLDVLSSADTLACVRSLAAMHAQYWRAPKLGDSAGLYQFSDWAEIYEPVIRSGWPLFQQDFDVLIPDQMRPMFEPGNAAAGAIFKYFCERRPKTLLHGDARIENFCFDADSGEARAYDWQLAAAGPGIYDLIYFFANSVAPETLFEEGEALLKAYHASLVEGGVSDYSFDELMRDGQLAAVLLFGFCSMVGNFLSNGGETEYAIVSATTPRYWGVCHFFKVEEIIHSLDSRLME